MKNYIFVICMFMTVSAFGQQDSQNSSSQAPPQSLPTDTQEKSLGEKASEQIEDVTKKYENTVSEMSQRRESSDFSILGVYAPLGTWIPGKFGVSLNYIRNKNWNYELEGLYGSINYEFLGVKLSSFSEARVSLLARYFPSNSFNLFFGMHYENLELVLGDAMISALTGVNTSEYRLLALSNLGLALGLGNRWFFENGFTLGIDWLTLNQPIVPLRTESKFLTSNANQSDKDAVDKGLTALKYLPRVTVLKIALGWTF